MKFVVKNIGGAVIRKDGKVIILEAHTRKSAKLQAKRRFGRMVSVDEYRIPVQRDSAQEERREPDILPQDDTRPVQEDTE